MRISKELLKDLTGLKLSPKETYAEVIRRIIQKQRRLKYNG
jgi:hypothetical protein